MIKYLVIVESPKKVKSIKTYLGKDYEVKASYGHIIDLPSKKLSIDIKNQFEPSYAVMDDKKQVVKDIVNSAKKVQTVFLMTDGDREGEGIAFHVASILPKKVKIKRAIAYSITKKAVQDAIKNACDINQNIVHSYECRRILDRLAGYKTSFLVKQASGGSSAGRVQSASLRFLAEKEKEILAFVPIVYWDITAELITDKFEKIISHIKVPNKLKISTKEEAEKICDTLKKGPILVSSFDKKDVNIKPNAPFTTSSMQQAASSYLHWSPKKTMKIAQSLYETGKISYMRTDSVYIVSEVIEEIKKLIVSKYDKTYLPSKENVYASKKKAQEAHEAIRPTDILAAFPVNADEVKLYNMIWKRTISSQMVNAIYRRSSAEFKCKNYILAASGSKLLKKGWQLVWDYSTNDDIYMPDLTKGEETKAIDIKKEKKETQPPKRYSEASTVKNMEKLGIGRPSTFAATLETLKSRKYILIEKKAIHVTPLGLGVIKFLVDSNFCFVDLNFTSEMEDKLDEIAEQKLDKVTVLSDFWERLKQDIENSKKVKLEQSKTDFDCPICNEKGISAKLQLRHSNFGAFFGCERYKDKDDPCKYIAQVGKDGPVEKKKKTIEYVEFLCPLCESKMIKRLSKYGEFSGCEKYPKCHGMRDKDGNLIEFKKKSKKKFKKKPK